MKKKNRRQSFKIEISYGWFFLIILIIMFLYALYAQKKDIRIPEIPIQAVTPTRVPEIPITVCFKVVDENITSLSGYDAYLSDDFVILDVKRNVSGESCFNIINGHTYRFMFFKDGYFPYEFERTFAFSIPNYTSSCEVINGKISCKYYNHSYVYNLQMVIMEKIKLDLEIENVEKRYTSENEIIYLDLIADTNIDGSLTLTFEPYYIIDKSRIKVKGEGCGMEANNVISCPIYAGENKIKIKLTKDFDQEITMTATLNADVDVEFSIFKFKKKFSKTLKYVFEPSATVIGIIKKGECDTKISKVIIDGKEYEVCLPPKE